MVNPKDAKLCIQWLTEANYLTVEILSDKYLGVCSGCGKELQIQRLNYARLRGCPICDNCLLREKNSITDMMSIASNSEFEFEAETVIEFENRSKRTKPLAVTTKVKDKRKRKTKYQPDNENQRTIFDLFNETMEKIKKGEL